MMWSRKKNTKQGWKQRGRLFSRLSWLLLFWSFSDLTQAFDLLPNDLSFYQVIQKKNEKELKKLLSATRELDYAQQENLYQQTQPQAILWTMQEKAYTLVPILLEYGFSPAVEDALGNTPLSLAVKHRKYNLLPLFLSAENVWGKMSDKAQEVLFLEARSLPQILRILKYDQQIQYLFEHLLEGENKSLFTNAVYQEGKDIFVNKHPYFLAEAIEEMSNEKVNILLDLGYDIFLQKQEGEMTKKPVLFEAVDIIAQHEKDARGLDVLKSLVNAISLNHKLFFGGMDVYEYTYVYPETKNMQSARAILGAVHKKYISPFGKRIQEISTQIQQRNRLGLEKALQSSVPSAFIPQILYFVDLNPDLFQEMVQMGAHTAISWTLSLLRESDRKDIPLILERIFDKQDRNGDTLLHLGVRTRNPDMVESLLAYGSSSRIKNMAGEYPIDVAQKRGLTSIVSILRSREQLTKLLGDSSTTKEDLNQWLSANIASPDVVMKDGKPAKMYSKNFTVLKKDPYLMIRIIEAKRPDLFLELFRWWGQTYGPDFSLLLSQKDARGNTPLHLAVQQGEIQVVKMVLTAKMSLSPENACVWEKNRTQETPVDFAYRKNRTDLVQILNQAQYLCDLSMYRLNDSQKDNLQNLLKQSNEKKFFWNLFSLLLKNEDASQYSLDTLIFLKEIGLEYKDHKALWKKWLMDTVKALQQEKVIFLAQSLTPSEAPLIDDVYSVLLEKNNTMAKNLTPILQPFLVNPSLFQKKDSLVPLIQAQDMESLKKAWATNSGKKQIVQMNPNALHFAVGTKNLNIVKFLLEKGYPVNIQDVQGNTPLHAATFANDLEMVKFLFSQGADPSIKNLARRTPYDLSQRVPSSQIGQIFRDKAAYEAILSRGSDSKFLAFSRNKDLEYLQILEPFALHKAVKQRAGMLLLRLLEKGYDLRKKDPEGSTALHRALEMGNVHVILDLLKYHRFDQLEDFDEKNEQGLSVWEQASYLKNVNMMKFFHSMEMLYKKNKGSSDVGWKYPSVWEEVFQDQQILSLWKQTYPFLVHDMIKKDASLSNIQSLAKRGFSIRRPDFQGKTPLYLAVEKDRLDLVEWLIANKVSPDQEVYQGESPKELSRRLSNKLASYFYPTSPLHQAVLDNNVILVKKILKTRPNRNDTDMFGNTALHLAASQDSREVIQALLDYGFDASDQAKPAGYTPLQVAILASKTENIRLFLEQENAKEFLDLQDAFGNTALHSAVSMNDFSTVQILVNMGANVSLKNKQGKTPFEIAQNKDPKISKYLTPKSKIFQAITENNIKWTQKLLQEEPDSLQEVDSVGASPLHYAIMTNQFKIVKLLVEAGADVNMPEKSGGNTPLHLATLSNQVDLVKYFLSKGANKSITNAKNETAYDLAVSLQAKDLMALLAPEEAAE